MVLRYVIHDQVDESDTLPLFANYPMLFSTVQIDMGPLLESRDPFLGFDPDLIENYPLNRSKYL